MCFPGAPGRGNRRLALVVKCQHTGSQFHATLAVGKRGVSRKIQAQLDAAGMKAAGPIELLRASEVMPFKAETKFPKIAKKWTPARAHLAPDFGLGEERLV